MTTVVDLLILLVAVAGSSTLVGIGMWFYQRLRRLESQSKDVAQLSAQIDELRNQLGAMHEQVGELHERVDFAERMLAQGGDKRELPRG